MSKHTNSINPVHTSKGAPLSAPLAIIVNAAIALGYEVKALALGVRIMQTDIVASDSWRGLYLCKSSGRGLARAEHNGATLRPADKGQWCTCVERCATDATEAQAQALAICQLAIKAGYVGLGKVADSLASAGKASKPSKVDKASKVNTAGKLDKASEALDNALADID